MATITLTDRISVRVAAKDSTETSNQNKTNGGNVASALGGSGLTDSEKEELGESLGETVTDESGKTYARSDKVAGVLKTIAQKNKLKQPEEVHHGVTVGGHTYGFTGNPVAFASGTVIQTYYNGYENLAWELVSNSPIYCFKQRENDNVYIFTADTVFTRTRVDTGSSNVAGHNSLIDLGKGEHRIYMDSVINSGSDTSPSTPVANSLTYTSGSVWDAYMQDAYAWLFGEIETTGGAPLDPTGKSDEQIKRELEQGAAENNAVTNFSSDPNGTYIAITDENGNPLYFLGA